MSNMKKITRQKSALLSRQAEEKTWLYKFNQCIDPGAKAELLRKARLAGKEVRILQEKLGLKGDKILKA